MRTTPLVLLLLIAASIAASAQNTTPRTEAGNKTILFSIAGLGEFNIGGSYVTSVPLYDIPFDTTVIFTTHFGHPLLGFGAKFYPVDKIAVRGGLSFVTTTRSERSINDPQGRDNELSSFGFGISPAVEVHVINSGPVSVYTGGVASIGIFRTSSNPADTSRVETVSSSITYGAGAMIGVEYFPLSNISLQAEYQLGAVVSTLSSERNGVSFDGPTYTTIGIGSFAVTLGVHF